MAVSHVFSNTVANWTGTVTVGNSDGNTLTIAATDLVRPRDWNSAHNQFYTLEGNTAVASTCGGTNVTNVVYKCAGAITLAGSTSTVLFSCGEMSQLVIPVATTIGSAQGNSLVSLFPIVVPENLKLNAMNIYLSFNAASAANNSSAYNDISVSACIYEHRTDNAPNIDSVMRFSRTATMSWSSNGITSRTGPMWFSVLAEDGTTTLSAGQYFCGVLVSTANSATGGANTTALGASITMMLNVNHAIGLSGAVAIKQGYANATNNSQGLIPFQGIISTNTLDAVMACDFVTATGSRGAVAALAADFYLGTFR